MAERRKRITAEDVSRFLIQLRTLDIRASAPALADMDAVLSLARAESLTCYDAAYLHLALQMELPLATFDGELIRASKHQGVRLA